MFWYAMVAFPILIYAPMILIMFVCLAIAIVLIHRKRKLRHSMFFCYSMFHMSTYVFVRPFFQFTSAKECTNGFQELFRMFTLYETQLES